MYPADQMKNAMWERGFEKLPHILLISIFASHYIRDFFNLGLQIIFNLTKYVAISEEERILAKTKKGKYIS